MIRAEEVGVPIYLESSPAASGLYRRLGFMELKKLKVLGDGSTYAMTVFIKYPDSP